MVYKLCFVISASIKKISFTPCLYQIVQLTLVVRALIEKLNHTKLLTHIPNKKELHLTAHAPTPVGANELPVVYPSKSSRNISGYFERLKEGAIFRPGRHHH